MVDDEDFQFDPDNIKVTIGASIRARDYERSSSSRSRREKSRSPRHSRRRTPPPVSSTRVKHESLTTWDDDIIDEMLEASLTKSIDKKVTSSKHHSSSRSSTQRRSKSRESRRQRSRSRERERSKPQPQSSRTRSRSRERRRRSPSPKREKSKSKEVKRERRRSRERSGSGSKGLLDPNSSDRCFRCLRRGHKALDCPNPPRCLHCREIGHMEVDCPDRVKAKAVDEDMDMELDDTEDLPVKREVPVERRGGGRRRRSRSPPRRRERYFDPFYYRSRSPEYEEQRRSAFKDASGGLKDERDCRTCFCMQLSPRIQAQDLYDFFSTVGKVNEVKIIFDKYQRRSKGIAYIEFRINESVPLATQLTGQKLLGVPIQVHASQAEKNKNFVAPTWTRRTVIGPPKLDIGNLHPDIKEDMLQQIFEPFGMVQKVEIVREVYTGRSKGFGHVLFTDHDSANKAKEKLNGFDLAGRQIRVTSPEDDKKNISTEEVRAQRQASNMEATAAPFLGLKPATAGSSSILDMDEVDRGGVNIGRTGRLALMAKLASGTGMKLPEHAQRALESANAEKLRQISNQGVQNQVTTPCYQLANVFNAAEETDSNWANDIRDDILQQLNQYGGAAHIYVDKNSREGIVYIKSPSISVAASSVQALHGRFFGGRMIKASYIPLQAYQYRFPESQAMATPLKVAAQ